MGIFDKIFKRDTKIEPIYVQYNHIGKTAAECYNFTLIRKIDEAHVIVKFGDDLNMDRLTKIAVMDKVTALFERLNIQEWDEFDGKAAGNPSEEFSLTVKYSDQSSVNAKGVNSFPAGLKDMDSGLKDIISSILSEDTEEPAPLRNRIRNSFRPQSCHRV